MDKLLHDLRYSIRRLRHAPGFALVAVATLALGIGANTAIFSFVNGLLFKPPGGVTQPDRLVRVFTADFSSSMYAQSSWPDFEDFRAQRAVFTDLAALVTTPIIVSRPNQLERMFAEIVTPGYFNLLGVQPVAGRLLAESDVNNPALIVLGENVWRTRFGGDADLIGASISVNGRPYTLIGIAPASFGGLTTGSRIDAWTPLAAAEHLTGSNLTQGGRDSRGFAIVGRLQPGITVPAAQSRMNLLQKQLFSAYPEEWATIRGDARTLSVLSERAGRVPPDQRGAMFTVGGLLLGAVAFVLLICCANLANLLLARASGRSREIAVRYSLGAARSAILRQMLMESALLAVAGGLAGLLLAVWTIDLISQLGPIDQLPIHFDRTFDGRVLGFTAAVSLLTGILFGIAPALQTSRASLASLLKSERAINAGVPGARLRDALVAAQIAIALVLAIGAGLIARTLQNASRVDVGLNTDNVVVASFDLGSIGYDEVRSRQFHADLQAQLSARNDVQEVTLAQRIPLAHAGGRRGVQVTGYTPSSGEEMEFPFNVVAANYFQALQLPIVNGRAFEAADRADMPVVVVNESFARRFWPGQNPIGREITTGRTAHQVVGVARDGKYWSINEAPRPYFYLPSGQNPGGLILHVRVRGDTEAVQEAIRSITRSLDAQVPVLMLDTMQGQMAMALMPQRIAGTLVGLFAVLAVLLAGIGVYGVTSVLVAQRIPELGLRVALGASGTDVMRLILSRTALVAGAGVVGGLAIALLATSGLESLLYGVSRLDPLTFALSAAALTAAALLAAYIPARRALRVDPLIALKS